MTPSLRYRQRVVVVQAVLVLILVALVEIAPVLGWTDVLTLVPFSRMVAQLWEFFRTGEIYPHLVGTVTNVILAFSAAVVTGIPMGWALWRWPTLYNLLNPYLGSYYAVPMFAFYPLLIVFFGLTTVPMVVMAWAWAVVAVVVNTASGLREVRPVFRKVARVYRLRPWHRFWRVEFPAAAPYVFNGLKLAVTCSIIGIIASEFVVSTRGLGWLVAYHYNNFGLAQMYAGMLLVLLLALAIHWLVGKFQRRVRGERP